MVGGISAAAFLASASLLGIAGEVDFLSSIVSTERRLTWPLVASAVSLALATGLLTFIVVNRAVVPVHGPVSRQSHPDPGHADWKIRVQPAGALGKVSKQQRKRIEARAPKLRAAVRRIYDALYLEAGSVEKIAGRSFGRRAARKLLASNIGVPEGARMKAVARRARIGVAARGANHAVAQVSLRMRGMHDGDLLRFRHTATLWMARRNGAWTVIGFDMQEVPIR